MLSGMLRMNSVGGIVTLSEVEALRGDRPYPSTSLSVTN